MPARCRDVSALYLESNPEPCRVCFIWNFKLTMNFDESFFQSSSDSEGEESKDSVRKKPQVFYRAKRCEPKVSGEAKVQCNS